MSKRATKEARTLRAGVRGREEEVEVAWTLIAGSAHVAIDLDWLRDFLRVMCCLSCRVCSAESSTWRVCGGEVPSAAAWWRVG